MPIITVPKVLRDKLGEEGADALVALINAADTQSKGDVLTFVEEKFERRLSEEAAKFNSRLTEEVTKLNVKMTNLEAKILEVKADLIRWMFIFWVGQLGAILGSSLPSSANNSLRITPQRPFLRIRITSSAVVTAAHSTKGMLQYASPPNPKSGRSWQMIGRSGHDPP